MALRKMMPEKQQLCSRTGRSWILPSLHKIPSKNMGKGMERKEVGVKEESKGKERRKGHKEGRRSQNGGGEKR